MSSHVKPDILLYVIRIHSITPGYTQMALKVFVMQLSLHFRKPKNFLKNTISRGIQGQ